MYDFLFVIIELFSLALTVETLQVEICRRERFLKAGGSLRSPIKGGRGRRPPTTVGWQKTRRIALSYGIKNIAGRLFGLVTKHACDGRTRRTDGQTDRQNYDSQDRASIGASRGNKNVLFTVYSTYSLRHRVSKPGQGDQRQSQQTLKHSYLVMLCYLWPCGCLSVCHKSVFSLNGWTDRAVFGIASTTRLWW